MAEASNIVNQGEEKPFETRIVEDTISYQKMIPSFHFLVSFVEEDTPVVKLEEEIEEDKSKEGKENKEPLSKEPIPFSEVSGLSMELQTEDIMEGGDNGNTIRLPKPPKSKNLVLKKALSTVEAEQEIISWAQRAIEDFEIETRTVIVSIVDFSRNPVKTWNFDHAYPVKLSISDLSASKNEIVIETLELAYRKVKQVK